MDQRFDTVFEQISMREEEISELRDKEEQLKAKVISLEKHISELCSKIANLELINQE
jgi:hypothetical protein